MMRSTRFFELLLVLLELLLLNGCFAFAVFLRYDDLAIENDRYYDYYLQLVVFLNLSWLLISLLLGSHRLAPTAPLRWALSALGRTLLAQLAVLGVFILMLKGDYSRLFFLYYIALFLPGVFLLRVVLVELYRAYLRKPQHQKRIVLIGASGAAKGFVAELQQHPEYGLRLDAWYADEHQEHAQFKGSVKNADLQACDEVFVALQPNDDRLPEIYQSAEKGMTRFRYLPEMDVHFLKKATWELYGAVPVLKSRREPLEFFHNRLLKRLVDVFVAGTVILFVMPWLTLVVAILIKLSSKGPVLYKQLRTGINEQPFWCYKFRSMYVNNPHPEQQASAGDARITAAGRWLRKYNIDEFPQFFQVLNGRMSLVGPRPHMVEHTDAYRKQIATYMVRHYIKPGLTGLAQINGFRGPTETLEQMEARVREDVYYLENWSLFLDLRILMKTVYLTFKGQEQAF
jgi:putative colanic acid biosysnthesis UDP-glucose lipid carrier transferase